LSMTIFWRPRSSWPDSTTPPPHHPNFLPQLSAAIVPKMLLAGSASISSSVIYYQVRHRFWRSLLYFDCFRSGPEHPFRLAPGPAPFVHCLAFQCFGHLKTRELNWGVGQFYVLHTIRNRLSPHETQREVISSQRNLRFHRHLEAQCRSAL